MGLACSTDSTGLLKPHLTMINSVRQLGPQVEKLYQESVTSLSTGQRRPQEQNEWTLLDAGI